MKKKEMENRIKDIKNKIYYFRRKVGVLEFKSDITQTNLMHLESFYYDLKKAQQPEPELIPWDFNTWHKEPDKWQPVTRRGSEVTQLIVYDTEIEFNLAGLTDSSIRVWNKDGQNGEAYIEEIESIYDITHMRRINP